MLALHELVITGLAFAASGCFAQDSLEAALAHNDECKVSGDGCAVNALQLKAQQNTSDSASAWVAELLQELGGSQEDLVKTEAELGDCSGDDALPGDTVCYSGAFLTEAFSVKVRNGKVSMWAKGPKVMKCLRRDFHQTGQSISIDGISECGLTDVDYNIQYCSTQDQIMVNMITPMTVSVTLTSTPC